MTQEGSAASLSAAERIVLTSVWAFLEPSECERVFGTRTAPRTIEDLFAGWRHPSWAHELKAILAGRSLQLDRIERDTDGSPISVCFDGKGRQINLHVGVAADGGLNLLLPSWPFPAGFSGRFARSDEIDAVAELIRESPIAMGQRSCGIWYRRLGDVLKMQEKPQVFVGTRDSDGAIVAARISSVRDALVEGTPLTLLMAFQAAVHPRARGHALERCVVGPVARALQPIAQDGYGYVDAGNVAILKAMGGERRHWSVASRQLALPALASARPVGRAATQADIPRICALLEGAHGREELRPPLSVDWVARRFSRIPDYGLANVRMTDHAMLSLWLPGDEVEDVSPTRTRCMRVGYVGDFGFAGAEGFDEYRSLLAQARAEAHAAGLTHLITYTSTGSPGADALAALAEFDDSLFAVWARPEPPNLAEIGVYTDPFYV